MQLRFFLPTVDLPEFLEGDRALVNEDDSSGKVEITCSAEEVFFTIDEGNENVYATRKTPEPK